MRFKTDQNMWCVRHPSGKFLHEASSHNPAAPIVVVVHALGEYSWESMTEQGYRLDLVSMKTLRRHLGRDWSGCENALAAQ